MNIPLIFAAVSVFACLFVPTFVVAFVMLRSAARASALAATFSTGAFTGALVALLVSRSVVQQRHDILVTDTLSAVFITAGAVAGGVLAVYALGKLSRQPPWRRL
jgi:hypothetical protein